MRYELEKWVLSKSPEYFQFSTWKSFKKCDWSRPKCEIIKPLTFVKHRNWDFENRNYDNDRQKSMYLFWWGRNHQFRVLLRIANLVFYVTTRFVFTTSLGKKKKSFVNRTVLHFFVDIQQKEFCAWAKQRPSKNTCTCIEGCSSQIPWTWQPSLPKTFPLYPDVHGSEPMSDATIRRPKRNEAQH